MRSKWMQASKLAFASAVLCASGFSYAQQEVVLFGEIAIGQPLRIAKCGLNYEVTVHPLCYTGSGSRVTLIFPHGELPKYMQFEPTAYLKSERVIGVTIVTNGVIGQDEALQALQSKFGPPKTKSVDTVKTVAGANHRSISATWQINDVEISFFGTLQNVTDGAIMIGTPEYQSLISSAPRPRPM